MNRSYSSIVTKKLSEIELAFADFIQEYLGMTQDKVLLMFRQEGQISSKINEDVVYLRLYQESDDVDIIKERFKTPNIIQLKDLIDNQISMRVLTLKIIIYGPNSETLSTKIKECFFMQPGDQFLYDNNLSLIPSSIIVRNRFFEKINERWWERSDIELKFYNSIREIDKNILEIEDFNSINVMLDSDGKEIELEVE